MNLRLREDFLEAQSQGDRVLLEVLEFESFEMNGIDISSEALRGKFARRFLEALMCLECEEGTESMNR